MNLVEELKTLDPKQPGNWPWPIKAGAPVTGAPVRNSEKFPVFSSAVGIVLKPADPRPEMAPPLEFRRVPW